MVYEIVRYTDGLMGIEFRGDVPVEVRETLKKAGWTWDWYRGAWTDLDCHEDWAVRALIEVAMDNVKPRHKMTKEEEKALKEEYLALVLADEKNPEHWRKYYEEKIGTLVRLTDGSIVEIEKPKIETSFCYGESGYDMEDAMRSCTRAMNSEDHFRWANLKELREKIDVLARSGKRLGTMCSVIVTPTNVEGISAFHIGSLWDHRGNKKYEEVSEEDRERLLEGYRRVYAAFEKRINAYLKRYGLTKVRAWTYWRDA